MAAVASPFAKKLAEEKGVDLNGVVGTGPEGRITAEDVGEGRASGSSPAPAYVSSKTYATPAATKLAKSKGIKLDAIKGTGNFGRITPDDVLIAAGEAEVLRLPPPLPGCCARGRRRPGRRRGSGCPHAQRRHADERDAEGCRQEHGVGQRRTHLPGLAQDHDR